MKTMLAGGFAAAFALALLGATPASAQPVGVQTAGDCTARSFSNPYFQNNQQFEFHGGKCGGSIHFSVTMSGASEPGHGDDAAVSIQVTSSGEPGNMCVGHYGDSHFDHFNIDCTVDKKVPPRGELNFVVSYQTNNVSDRPLPTMNLFMSYTPD